MTLPQIRRAARWCVRESRPLRSSLCRVSFDRRMMRRRLLEATVLSLLICTAAESRAAAEAQSQPSEQQLPPPTSPRPGTGGGPPPPYTLVRWNEDYSYLRDPAKRTDFFDAVKYVPIGDNPDV